MNNAENWRWLTPIFSMLSPTIVGAMAWFLINLYTVQQTANLQLMSKIDKYVEKQDSINTSIQDRLAQVKYQCCSELQARPSSYQNTYPVLGANETITSTTVQ